MHRATFVVEAGKPRRKSSFHEIGLEDQPTAVEPPFTLRRPSPRRNLSNIAEQQSRPGTAHGADNASDGRAASIILDTNVLTTRSSTPLYTRLAIFAVVFATLVSLAQNTWLASGQTALPVAEGGTIPAEHARTVEIARRDDSPTDICRRWSGQAAIVNGTLYYYGGRATTDQSQKSNTWNNYFISLDLTKTWDIGSPTFKGLPQPSGPPPVANGYLWNSHSSLFLYGGEFSDTPAASPVAFSLWEYDIASASWNEHSSPQTSAGTNSEDAGQPIQRVAEGAGANMASLGRGWYFGGHEDFLTTEGWSNQVPREYLKSFVEFTFPGSPNGAVQGLSGGAGSDGAWRNITQAGIQETGGFTERADGVLLYVPGFGKEGILVALAGGTNDSFTQMNVIDVYDIEGSTWYKQATSGPTPNIRVNPCAVVAAAPDGSSYNIHMFAGQNLQPYQGQTQYQDLWILSIPSFTWINVTMDGQSVPYGRSGHTCNIWDGQMVVVGGYIGEQIPCDSPGVYVFNCSSLEWSTKFTSLSAGGNNAFSQQSQQQGSDPSEDGLEGSYGYTVPDVVVSVIGGNSMGGATVTAPVQSATEGPMATGKPITYTLTGPGGSVVTETSTAGGSNSGGSGGSGGGGGGSGTGSSNNNNQGSNANIGAIVAGVIAGVLFVIALYLGFCAWLYRKQLQLYKNHVAMAQRQAADPSRAEKEGFILPGPLKNSTEGSSTGQSGSGDASGSGGVSGNWRASDSQNVVGAAPVPALPASNRGSYQTQQGPPNTRGSDAGSSSDNLLSGMEPTFVGVLLNPKRSLRIVNRD